MTKFADLDASDGAVDGVFNVSGDLTIANHGAITCDSSDSGTNSGCPIRINVGGNMEIQAGGSVHANTPAADGAGGSIRITTGGNFTMRIGNDLAGIPSAFVSARNTASSAGSGSGGDVVIISGGVTVDASNPTNAPTCGAPTGDIVVEPFASISTDAPGAAGAIQLYAGHNITIQGTLSSGASNTTSGQGGPITVDACNAILVTDSGVIRSSGKRSGADLVHVQGCSVNILGLVQSTGDSDEPQGTCPSPCTSKVFNNLCNNPPRPGHQDQIAAAQCVEDWAGSTLKIDATDDQRGS